MQALLSGAVTDHILSLGPLSKNNEWYLCLKSDAVKDHLLSAGSVKAKGYTFRIRSADISQFKVTIHWVPPFLPNDMISTFLSWYGKVHFISYEKSVSRGSKG